MKFSINQVEVEEWSFYKKNEIFRIWSHLLKKALMENFIFCAVTASSEH